MKLRSVWIHSAEKLPEELAMTIQAQTTSGAALADPLLENVRLAIACGANATMTLVVALASSGAKTPDEAFAVLDERRDELTKLMLEPGGLKNPAPLEPELCFEPELARIRPELADHEVRGKLLFKQLLGKQNFFQVAAFEIAGVELRAEDADLLADVGVLIQFPVPQIWPLAVTRRIAARGGGLARALVAGTASFCTENMAVLPVAGFMQFLDRVDALQREGRTLEEIVDAALARRERILGVGRPAFGPDERVAPQMALNERYGRSEGPNLRLAKQLDALLYDRKGLRVNSAGFHGALMRDLGFTPAAAAAFCVIYFIVPVLANVVYAEERCVKVGSATSNELASIER
jgi:hypothetical protein